MSVATDSLLLAELRLRVKAARRDIRDPDLDIGLIDKPTLRRTGGQLYAFPGKEIDLPGLLRMIREEAPDGWNRLRELTTRLEGDDDAWPWIDVGPTPEERALPLWTNVIGPMVHLYGLRYPNWRWSDARGRACLEAWRHVAGPNYVQYRTLVPLHNIAAAPDLVVRIASDVVIRPLTDSEREAMWQNFGGPQNPSTIAPTVAQLEAWTHVIDVTWTTTSQSLTAEMIVPTIEKVGDVVSVLRLQSPGVVGWTIWWTRPEQPDLVVLTAATREMIGAPNPGASFEHDERSSLAVEDAKPLADLWRALPRARKEKRLPLVLRRFNSAYERHSAEDSLIDLWIAFEALLIPDDNAELSYRASLRLARIAEDDHAARVEALKSARASYGLRSKIVHGTAVPTAKLDETLRTTRELARKALRRWVLDPPTGGTEGIDERLLT